MAFEGELNKTGSMSFTSDKPVESMRMVSADIARDYLQRQSAMSLEEWIRQLRRFDEVVRQPSPPLSGWFLPRWLTWKR